MEKEEKVIARLLGRLAPALLLMSLPVSAQQEQPSAPQEAVDCAANERWQAICGPSGVEDLAVLPGNRWLIGSGLNFGVPAHLVLIDGETQAYHSAYPEGAIDAPLVSGSDCMTPPDADRFSFSGLALVQPARGEWRLLAVNHGDRRAVEFFRVTDLAQEPRLAWEGCAMLPADSDPNGVAALPDGRIVVTDFRGADATSAWALLDQGAPTGSLVTWQAGRGVTEREAGLFSGPNGVAVSPDGARLYISDWGGRRLLIRDLALDATRGLSLDFLPDNIDVLPDGRLLVAGQIARPAAIGSCTGALCPQDWVIALIDPETNIVTRLVEAAGTQEVSYATSAAVAGGKLYITVRGMDRVLVTDLPPAFAD